MFDTAGSLPITTPRALLQPGGRIIAIVPTRITLPGPYSLFMGRPDVRILDELAAAAACGKLRIPIARTVTLDGGVRALLELETGNTSTGGKSVIIST